MEKSTRNGAFFVCQKLNNIRNNEKRLEKQRKKKKNNKFTTK